MQINIDSSKVVTAAAQLQTYKNSRIAVLSAACRTAIKENFESRVLGESHAYPSNETDQLNLASSVADSLLPGLAADWVTPFWCLNQAGEWAMRMHTAEQIQQLGREAKARIVSLMQRNALLAEQVQQASSKAEVDQFEWAV